MRIIDNSETTPIRAYHIIKQQKEYNIYSPKLALEGGYTSYAVALKKAKDMNTQRHMIIVHNTNGTIKKTIRPSKEKKLSLAENGKAIPKTKRKKTIVLDER